jgi:hypothetical protein
VITSRRCDLAGILQTCRRDELAHSPALRQLDFFQEGDNVSIVRVMDNTPDRGLPRRREDRTDPTSAACGAISLDFAFCMMKDAAFVVVVVKFGAIGSGAVADSKK